VIGYSGSQNICDGEFVKGFPNEEWLGALEGPVVWQLQAVFLADYYLETNQVLDDVEIFSQAAQTGESHRPGAAERSGIRAGKMRRNCSSRCSMKRGSGWS